MKPREQKFSFAVISLSVLIACSVFTPAEPGSATLPAEGEATSEGQGGEVTQESPGDATGDTFKVPGGKMLFGTSISDPNTSEIVDTQYFMLNLADQAVEPFPALAGVRPSVVPFPAYSPDYSHLAFQRFDRSRGSASIFLFGPEKAEAVQIGKPRDKQAFEGLTWSSNGHFLGYWFQATTDYDQTLNLSVYGIDTGALKAVPFKTKLSQFPDLSPNGDRIAFSSQARELDQYGNTAPNGEALSGLYLMNADGTHVQQLVSGQVWRVKWHPDGTRIFYEKEVTKQDENSNTITISPRQVYSYDLAAGAETLITPSERPVLLQDISPDGKLLTYSSQAGVFVISTDGGDAKVLPLIDWLWSPDSQYLAYTKLSLASKSTAIYIMDTQGGGRVMVYDDTPVDELIAWLP